MENSKIGSYDLILKFSMLILQWETKQGNCVRISIIREEIILGNTVYHNVHKDRIWKFKFLAIEAI